MDVYVLKNMMTNDVLDQPAAISCLFSDLSSLPTLPELVSPAENTVQAQLNDLTHAMRNDLQVICLQIDLLDLSQTDGPSLGVLLRQLMYSSQLL